MTLKKSETKPSSSTTVAKFDDGSIQINFTIPYNVVEEKRREAIKEIGETLEVAGFRKWKAPLDKVEAAVNESSVLEKTLSKILPPLLGETIQKHNLKLAIYRKFTLRQKQSLATLARGKKDQIWTPGSKKEDKHLSKEKKEQIAIETLLETTNL